MFRNNRPESGDVRRAMTTPVPTLDDVDVDRLLSGAAAPEGYSAVAALLSAAREAPGPEVSDPARIAAMVSEIRASSPVIVPTSQKRRRLAKLLTAKVAAVAAFAIVSTGVAGAATGTLPEPVQNGIAEAASHVGLNLPSRASDRARAATSKAKGENGRAGNGVGTAVAGKQDSPGKGVGNDPGNPGKGDGNPARGKGSGAGGPAPSTTALATTAPAEGSNGANHGASARAVPPQTVPPAAHGNPAER